MIVEVEHVSKTIGKKEIIHDLNFNLMKRRILALIGPNGSGKTTIVRLIMGLIKPSSGKIRLFNTDINDKNVDAIKKYIGVQNDGNLCENLTVFQNLDLWGQIYGIERITRRRKINDILEFFDLENRLDSYVCELSKGMRQKVSIARAILHEPDLLILDEPTSS